jgi:hypothetical protein
MAVHVDAVVAICISSDRHFWPILVIRASIRAYFKRVRKCFGPVLVFFLSPSSSISFTINKDHYLFIYFYVGEPLQGRVFWTTPVE